MFRKNQKLTTPGLPQINYFSGKSEKYINQLNPGVKNNSAFTLVELIIVITILAILATIAFISFQGYSKNARDGNRLTTMKNISKGLEIYKVQSGNYPQPDESINIEASGTLIGYQGKVGDAISRMLKINVTPTDPYDKEKYIYSTSSDKTKYQILGYLETPDYLTLLNQSYATDYNSRYVKTLGDKVGIILNNDKTPITGTGINIATGSTAYNIYFGDSDSINGSGNVLYSNIYNRRSDLINNKNLASLDSSLVGYWDMETLSGGKLRDFSKSNLDMIGTGGIIIGGENGYIGKSTKFNGNNDFYVDTTNLNISGAFSFSFWLNSNDIISNPSRIFRQLGDGGLHIYQASGKLTCGIYDLGNSTYQNISLGFIADDNWHLINCIYNNGEIKAYKDGVYVGNTILTGIGKVSSSTSFRIGSHKGISEFYKGIMDEVRIYNRALSDLEIQGLYNLTK